MIINKYIFNPWKILFCNLRFLEVYNNIHQNCLILFTNPSARAGYDTRSIFKRSFTGFNSEFSFS